LRGRHQEEVISSPSENGYTLRTDIGTNPT
jgi:hypothetical protein